MRRRTIELRSGTWEWDVVDPDDPRRRASGNSTGVRAGAGVAATESTRGHAAHAEPTGAPPLPRRRVELRSTADGRMCVRVPPHLGHAGDDAAVTMLAHNPDRRTVVDPGGNVWALWPEDREPTAPGVTGTRTVRALREGERPRTLVLPDGLALGQLTDREILDLLG